MDKCGLSLLEIVILRDGSVRQVYYFVPHDSTWPEPSHLLNLPWGWVGWKCCDGSFKALINEDPLFYSWLILYRLLCLIVLCWYIWRVYGYVCTIVPCVFLHFLDIACFYIYEFEWFLHSHEFEWFLHSQSNLVSYVCGNRWCLQLKWSWNQTLFVQHSGSFGTSFPSIELEIWVNLIF